MSSRWYSVLSLLLVLTLVITACGGGEDDEPTPVPTAEPTELASEEEPVDTNDEPTETTTEEADPTPTTPEPSPTPTEEPQRSAQIDALWFSFDGQNAAGGTSTVDVDVQPAESGEIRVGFFESEVGGTGPQWRTSGWMAVITASLLLGTSPSDYEFSFDVAGRIDGPSAGALMTSAVLASMLGDEIDPTVTMTGTINPDGSIGPVGGIPHKIVGAAEAGKTTVLVPAGQRFDYDFALQQSVDLVDVGQDNGVEVILVPDIYTAYEHLTGSQLPAAVSAGTASMPSTAFDRLRAGATDWFARYQQERARFNELPAEVQDFRIDIIWLAEDLVAEADQLLQEGQVSRSYQLFFEAAMLVKVGTQAAELDNLYLTGGVDPMISRLESTASSETRLSALIQRLEAESPRTASDTIAMIDAASSLSIAEGLLFQANGAIEDLQFTEYTEDDILTAIYVAAFNFALADLYLDIAEDTLSFGIGFGSAEAPPLDVLESMAQTFRRGAESNIAYFDSLIIEPWAQENGVSTDIAKLVFEENDDIYLTAVAAINGADLLIESMDDDEARAIMQLGAALVGYNYSAVIIAEYYSLDARVDEFGGVVDYGRQTALAEMLDLADHRAQEWLSSVADEEPVLSLYYYEIARLQRQGDATEQLSALSGYWLSATLSEVLAIFTSNPS
ncbi:MAG: S16 family serine protease [Chloroflexota bacterium]